MLTEGNLESKTKAFYISYINKSAIGNKTKTKTADDIMKKSKANGSYNLYVTTTTKVNTKR